ncbi:hypothetical protein ACSS6W_010505 [Trichoderma asperelloides]|nr:hypothetical protein LI328DRAFT_156657 [Trichoderma asperelloides]
MKFSTFFLSAAGLVQTQIASACLVITGSSSVGQFTTGIDIHANDNGVVTCQGHINSGSGNVGCNGGYSLWVDDVAVGDHLRVKYGTPHGSWDFYVYGDCNNWDCSLGNAPFTCWGCTYDQKQFGC